MWDDSREEKVCGKCRYHRCECGEWFCDNDRSDYCGCETEYKDTCPDFEEREESGKKE